jgi:hypothetical protein
MKEIIAKHNAPPWDEIVIEVLTISSLENFNKQDVGNWIIFPD